MNLIFIDLLILIIGIIFLFLVIVKFKLNSFLSLLLTSIFIGLALGMDIQKISDTITKGLGETLGGLAIILSIGSMLGKLMADSGAARKIAISVINSFGAQNIRWSVCIASFLVGFALFYEVGFILLIPIVFTIANELKINPLEAGIPMVAALSVTHGFLPPHPGPVMIADTLKADLGLTLFYGCIVATPVFIVAGPIFYSFVRNIKGREVTSFENQDLDNLPSFFTSVISALIPVILMLLATFLKFFSNESFHQNSIYKVIEFLGSPNIALLLAILVAIYILGLKRGRTMSQIGKSLEGGVKSIAMILLVIAGGGVLKQILIDSGLSSHISDFINKSSFSPLIAAWLIVSLLRIALGSASVAAITTASIVLPLTTVSGVNLELMVLSIGAGSVILSLPNDPGFWMFKEFFNLSIKQTLLTWSLLETIIAVFGLIMVLILNLFV
ncbi:gluconate:H+ symporter [Campylobacter sp. B0100352/1]|uniref:gluconate:H+ symporter n=1 Tax=Campylobacter sp. B0100352/1 TaxID=2735783 RepID=UPI00301C655A